MDLEIIINPKTNDDGHAVVQLETAAGAAIKHFKNAHGINVPRKRFLPVKSCSDLLLIKSDIYSLQHGQLIINPQRMFETTPVIKLGEHFKKVSVQIESMPSMIGTGELIGAPIAIARARTFFLFFARALNRSNNSRRGSRRSRRFSSLTT